MLLQKQKLIEWLVERGEETKAWDLDANLPPELDSEKDRHLLAQHGIDVDAALGHIDPFDPSRPAG